MTSRILVLGGTGMLGKPVVSHLVETGHRVRLLTRSEPRARALFGDAIEVTEGTLGRRDDLAKALSGCEAVHLNLTPATEYAAMRDVLELSQGRLDRVSYVSATTLTEDLRWFPRVDIKLSTEELLRGSGVPYVIFRPTWVMETLINFVRGRWALSLVGKSPPALHFFAAADFGRIVAASYQDDRGLGKALYVYGPEGITLNDATERFATACHPEARLVRLSLWQGRLLGKVLRNQEFLEVIELVTYLDVAGEQGDPTEANALYGGPTITLDEWCAMPKDAEGGMPH